jgi:hypothetical protein
MTAHADSAVVKDKIRKLLRLANSPNEHEAAAAAAKAQELCDLHNLTASQIGDDPEQAGPDLESLEISPLKGKREGWEEYLLAELAEACDCTPWVSCETCFGYNLGKIYMAVGYPADVALLQYLYPFLQATILRLYRQGLEQQKARCRGWTTRHTYLYKRGFTFGAAHRIVRRLTEIRDARRAQDEGTRALVVVKEQQLWQWVECNLGELKPSAARHKETASPAGYADGQAAAESINLSRPLEHQGAGHRQEISHAG